ncbi:hypothetical protein OESDEN_11361 [Oesophagostomum dentatum]|uniref:Uncharacterized protein n=1 Tax=Oesophagostomum dentatum TaxID=61180 RepID=A0A0B1SY44_OESDE|nr:hypothetical protein OESDEN_11361 [Oesophagostomum dentatum]
MYEITLLVNAKDKPLKELLVDLDMDNKDYVDYLIQESQRVDMNLDLKDVRKFYQTLFITFAETNQMCFGNRDFCFEFTYNIFTMDTTNQEGTCLL